MKQKLEGFLLILSRISIVRHIEPFCHIESNVDIGLALKQHIPLVKIINGKHNHQNQANVEFYSSLSQLHL